MIFSFERNCDETVIGKWSLSESVDHVSFSERQEEERVRSIDEQMLSVELRCVGIPGGVERSSLHDKGGDGPNFCLCLQLVPRWGYGR